jgi:hypothetical protein
MSREPGPDDGREESYDDDGSQARASGVLVGHRYGPEADTRTEGQKDARARREVMQEMADEGRPVHSIPWWGRARDKAKVRHRRWEKAPNGWAHCKERDCGFPVPANRDDLKIAHQAEHDYRARVLSEQAADVEALIERCDDLQRQLDVEGEERARDRLRLDALMLALGHPDHDALQTVVDEVMSLARQINAAARKRKGNDEI